MVSHCWLLFFRKKSIVTSHLDCARKIQTQLQAAIKLRRVFPSRSIQTVSSRLFLFHRVRPRDSVSIIALFVRVVNHTTMNFATLGPSRLGPPFTRTSIESVNPRTSSYSIGQTTALIRSFYNFAKTCVFNKQLPKPILCDHLISYGLTSSVVT